MTLLSDLRSDAQRLTHENYGNLQKLKLTLTNSSFSCAVLYRVSHALWKKTPQLARLLSRLNLVLHGADVDPRAIIGSGILFQHPVGVVIGNDCRIGSNVTLMSGVVLGRKNVLGGPDKGQYPTLGQNVMLGTHAVVLGPVTVGSGAIVGAHSLVLHDVPAGATAAGSPARLFFAQSKED